MRTFTLGLINMIMLIFLTLSILTFCSLMCLLSNILGMQDVFSLTSFIKLIS